MEPVSNRSLKTVIPSEKGFSMHHEEATLARLRAYALGLRIDSIRATTASKSGHPTSCMSAADIIAALFFHTMNFDKTNPAAAENDHFIMSKGHAIPVVYAAYKALGVISDDELLSLRRADSPLEGHPTPRFSYNEAATGSLGQGLSIAAGYALQAKMDNQSFKTYVMMGDGEIAEGSIWEGAAFAAHYKLNNLIGVVDCNRLGQSDSTMYAHAVESIAQQFTAFGWQALVVDGHKMPQILEALTVAGQSVDRPVVLIARTFKGQGLAGIADKLGFHGKPFTPQEAEAAIAELHANFPEAASELALITQMAQPAVLQKVSGAVQSKIQLNLASDSNAAQFALGKSMAPRKAFGYALAALGSASEQVVVLDADVKNSTHTDIFEKSHPTRFVQCFIAEQSMASVATGLALRHKIPFAATFGAFLTRCHDQIRMAGIGRNALRLCGSHCGVSIGEDGPSQMALEDIAMMRCIPGSVVLYPSDAVSAYALTGAMANYHDGISYLRATRESLPVLYDQNESFAIGGCKVLREGGNDQMCLVAAGITLHEALRAHEELSAQGFSVSVIDLYSIKPLDRDTLLRIARKSGNKIITIEDHYQEGGLGEAVNAALQNSGVFVKNMAVRGLSRSGSIRALLELAGIDSRAIVAQVEENL